MKYIIMCGGHYTKWQTPRQLTKIHSEPIVGRTIRLLREAGVEDISISTDHEAFKQFGLPILTHDNYYDAVEYNNFKGYWCDCFYPTNEPTCYIFGDVVFSQDAINTIVEYETDDIMLFGSKAPFAKNYPKWFIEPFAFKVADTQHLKEAQAKVKELDKQGVFHRKPIAWEFWNVVCGTDPNQINQSYVAINDYTCDIDYPEEIHSIESHVPEGNTMTEKKTEKKTTQRKTTKKKNKAPWCIYNGKEYTILEEQENKVKLTDGVIHFWVKKEKVDG